ncbi:MAG: EFR1 family ferrodoxin, partial [Treponema sp.]|jgi:ferredoxin|nr:EFR1 family ferrodoxin [Treponema sp.]
MVDNYIVMSDIAKNAGDLLKAAQVKIDSAGKTVQEKGSTLIQKGVSFGFNPGMGGNFFAAMDKNYTVSEQCTGCSICVNLCPVQNITMENKRPKFNHECEQCFACLHHCPEKAIDYENTTQNKKRYINPDIKLEEILYGNTGRVQ